MTQIQKSSASGSSFADDVTRDWARQMYLTSVDTLRGAASTMVTVATGFFAIYFAIMKFLGAETVVSANAPASNLILFALPPLFLVVSVICFAWSMLPIRQEIGLDDLSSIRKARTSMAVTRWRTSILGWVFFVAAMVLTIVAALAALRAAG